MENFNGSRAILSGPAGGVVGYAKTAYEGRAVIGFDMGGTSTDVSRYGGAYEHVFETTTAGVTIQAPQLDISTVAAGGTLPSLFLCVFENLRGQNSSLFCQNSRSFQKLLKRKVLIPTKYL